MIKPDAVTMTLTTSPSDLKKYYGIDLIIIITHFSEIDTELYEETRKNS